MLDAQKMLREAWAIAGLDAFDRDDVERNLARLVEAINTETHINESGEKRLHTAGVYCLVNRLLLRQFLATHESLKNTDIGPAIIIIGFPRTGSTKLQRLIAQDGRLDHMKFWEVVFPLAYPGEQNNEIRLKLINGLERELGQPELTAGHNLDAAEPEEELLLQKSDFTVSNIRDHLDMPIWLDEMIRRDPRPRYEVVRQFIVGHKVQRRKQGLAWIFKNAYAAEHADVIAETFPNAKLIFTHRDPVDWLCSITSLGHKYRQLYSAPGDKQATGAEFLRYWSGFAERALRACERVPANRLLHVRYRDALTDPIATIRKVYDFCELELTPEAESSIHRYDERNRQHQHGRHDYTLEEFGLTREGIESAFHDYLMRYGDMVH
jgi:Sulfotransferase family